MTESSPQVVVIAGPNGAGKSTLAPFLLRDTFGVLEYVNADPIALGLSAFDSASMSFEAGRIVVARLRDLAKRRKSFAFETTLASRFYALWVKRLRESGYRFHLVFLWLSSIEWRLNGWRSALGVEGIPYLTRLFADAMTEGLQTSSTSTSRSQTPGQLTTTPVQAPPFSSRPEVRIFLHGSLDQTLGACW